MNIVNWIEDYWDIGAEIQWKVIFSFIVIFGLWLLRYFASKIIFKSIEDIKERYHWKNGVRNIQYALIIIIISAIWVDRIGSLATFLGLVTAGLAIAMQDPLVNVAGWFFIVIRKPFEVGDRVQVGEFAGDVIDIRFFQFTLNEIGNWVDADQSTGRIIHVPNGQVFKIPQANYNKGFSHIWHEIGVLVTFESDWEKAKSILERIVMEHAEHLSKHAERKLLESSKKFMIFYSNLTPIVYTDVKDSGVMLTMRFLVDPKKRRITSQKIWEDTLRVFAENDNIDFAYPTQRIYFNQQEGKIGATKPPNFS